MIISLYQNINEKVEFEDENIYNLKEATDILFCPKCYIPPKVLQKPNEVMNLMTKKKKETTNYQHKNGKKHTKRTIFLHFFFCRAYAYEKL